MHLLRPFISSGHCPLGDYKNFAFYFLIEPSGKYSTRRRKNYKTTRKYMT